MNQEVVFNPPILVQCQNDLDPTWRRPRQWWQQRGLPFQWQNINILGVKLNKIHKMKADIRSKNVYNIDEWWDVFARPKLASKRLACWRCLRGVYWRPDLAVMAVVRKRPVLAATAVERKRPSLAVTAVKHKRPFLAITVMTRLNMLIISPLSERPRDIMVSCRGHLLHTLIALMR